MLRTYFAGILAFFLSTMVSVAQATTKNFDCLVKPDVLIKLGSPVEGILTEVSVERGDAVSEGQIIARIEDSVEQASAALAKERALSTTKLALSRARYEYQARKHERTGELYSREIISDADRDEAQTDAAIAQLQIADEEFNARIADLEYNRSLAILAQKIVRSPYEGIVVERFLSPGEYAHEQSHIISIAKIDPLNIEVFVPVDLYGKIKLGDHALVRFEEPIGGVYEAEVTIVDKVFDAASSTFGVRLLVANSNYDLPAGLRCKVEFPSIG